MSSWPKRGGTQRLHPLHTVSSPSQPFGTLTFGRSLEDSSIARPILRTIGLQQRKNAVFQSIKDRLVTDDESNNCNFARASAVKLPNGDVHTEHTFAQTTQRRHHSSQPVRLPHVLPKLVGSRKGSGAASRLHAWRPPWEVSCHVALKLVLPFEQLARHTDASLEDFGWLAPRRNVVNRITYCDVSVGLAGCLSPLRHHGKDETDVDVVDR